MHLKYQRRLHRAERAPLLNRDLPAVSNGPAFTGPITITFVKTLSGTATFATESTPAASQSTGTPTVNTILGLPTLSASSSVSSTEQTTSSSPSSTATSFTRSKTSVVSATATPSQTSNGHTANSQESRAASSPALSSGGIAGIIFAILVVLFIGLFLVLRKRSMSNRQRRRSNWTQSRSMDPPTLTSRTSNDPASFVGFAAAPLMETAETSPEMAYTQERPRILTVRNPTPSITAPSMSYNNNADALTSPVSTTSGGGSSPVSLSRTGIIVCTYITNLPDELAIKVGETMRIMAEYDDGWALCMNVSGEQGMVPLECLQLGSSEGLTSMRQTGSELDNRRSRRASSLNPNQASKAQRS